MDTPYTPTPAVVVLPDSKKSSFDPAIALRGMGVALLAITALLIWHEVSMDAVYLLLGGSAVTLGLSAWLERRKTPLVGPVLTLGSVVVGAAWYAATREPVVLGALGLGFVTFAGLAWRHRERTRVPATPAHRAAVFQGLAWSGLALSLATSFHLFHGSALLDEGFHARRVIVTVAWLVSGLGFVVFGHRREDGAMFGAGSVLTVAAMGKLLLYDTTHLDGVLRIAVFAAAGALMFFGGTLLTRQAQAVRS